MVVTTTAAAPTAATSSYSSVTAATNNNNIINTTKSFAAAAAVNFPPQVTHPPPAAAHPLPPQIADLTPKEIIKSSRNDEVNIEKSNIGVSFGFFDESSNVTTISNEDSLMKTPEKEPYDDAGGLVSSSAPPPASTSTPVKLLTEDVEGKFYIEVIFFLKSYTVYCRKNLKNQSKISNLL